MSDIQALEHSLERAKEVIEQRDRMVKLSENREFKKLIIEGFCKDEVARYTHLSTDPNLNLQDRADALAAAQAAGYLKRWINAIITMGNHAAGDVLDIEEALADARAGSVED